MIIKGKKPQAYDSRTQELNSVLIPAASIDFPDQENLEEKAAAITNDIINLQDNHNALQTIVDKPLRIPKQVGTLIYNGKEQRPVFDVESSRFTITGEISATDAGEYTAIVHLDNGTWEDTALELTQEVHWSIEQKRIQKPIINGLYIEDGTLQQVSICNTELEHVRIEGQIEARNTGNYNILVFLNDPKNVTWTDGTVFHVPLTWHMLPKIKQEEIDISELEGNVTNLKSTVSMMKQDILNNATNIEAILARIRVPSEGEENNTSITYECSQLSLINSLKRRIEMIEALIESGAIGGSSATDIKSMISSLEKQVSALENQAKSMTHSALEEEVNFLIKNINGFLEKATLEEDVDALNLLKVRVRNVYDIRSAEEELEELLKDIKSKEHEIRDILNSDNENKISEAEQILDELKEELDDILDKYSTAVKEIVNDTTKEIQDIIDRVKEAIVKKEAEDILEQIRNKISTLTTKVDNGEDVTDLINEIESLISQIEEVIGTYEFPYIRDELTNISVILRDTKTRIAAEATIKNLSDRVTDIINSIGTKPTNTLKDQLNDIINERNEVALIASQLNNEKLNTKLHDLEDDILEASTKLQRQEFVDSLTALTNDLTNLKTTAEEFNPETDNVNTLTDVYNSIAEQYDTLETNISATTIDLAEELKAVKDLLSETNTAIKVAMIKSLIYAVDVDVDKLRQDILDLKISYEDAISAISELEIRLAAIENMVRPEETDVEVLGLRARIDAVKLLNEDSKIYREVKPILNAMRAKIYDEDLDILWNELNTAKDKVSTASPSDWTTELLDEIAELEDILNSFSGRGEDGPDFEGLLSRFEMVNDIVITTENVVNDITTYDEAKTYLENLDRYSLTLTEDNIVISNFYSLSDSEKYYVLENTLRQIRKKALTTADVFTGRRDN